MGRQFNRLLQIRGTEADYCAAVGAIVAADVSAALAVAGAGLGITSFPLARSSLICFSCVWGASGTTEAKSWEGAMPIFPPTVPPLREPAPAEWSRSTSPS